MTFFNAKCVLCGQYHDKPDNLVAFTVRHQALELIDLRGEQPWCGVQVVCRRCIRFLRETTEGSEREECPACVGDGEVEEIEGPGKSQFVPCEECGGTGIVETDI